MVGGGTVTPTYFPYTPLVTQQPDSDEGHFISKAQNGVVDDKPFFVAEYNVLLPMAYNADTVLQAATYWVSSGLGRAHAVLLYF